MTQSEIFNLLWGGGRFNTPYLVEFSHGSTKIYLINDNKSVAYNGHAFQISSFEYNRPDANGNGASLSILADDDNNLIEFIENADENWNMKVIGILRQDNTVQELHVYNHFYGTVASDELGNLEFQLGKDDRSELQFCPYTFDTGVNPANA